MSFGRVRMCLGDVYGPVLIFVFISMCAQGKGCARGRKENAIGLEEHNNKKDRSKKREQPHKKHGDMNVPLQGQGHPVKYDFLSRECFV